MDNEKRRPLKPNPKATCNFLTSMFFLYVVPAFYQAYKTDFTKDDLFEPLKEDQSIRLTDTLEKNWKQANEKHKKYGLHIALFRTFCVPMIITGLLIFTKELARILFIPYSIGKLVSYFSQTEELITHLQAYVYAAILIICLALERLIAHPVIFWLQHVAMKTRVSCCGIIYRKLLRFNKSSIYKITTGHVVNLMSNDVSRMDSGVHTLHFAWVAPIESVVAIAYLYSKIGSACFLGVGFLLFLIPIQLLAAKKNAKLRLKTAQSTDVRVRLMNEIISGAQVIKMYTWEAPFAKLIEAARKKEIGFVRCQKLLWALTHFELYATRTAIFISLVCFHLMGEEITAEIAFSMVALFDVINHSVAALFEASIRNAAELNVSIQRINNFLNHTDTPAIASVAMDNNSLEENSPSPKVILENIEAKWINDSSDDTLSQISLNLTEPQLFAVVGEVGSGKSSLLYTIIGELPITSGTISISGKISYYEQEPWIFAASVRQNILFGDKYDDFRYRKVCDVCCLEPDFRQFPHGDQTQVGESGKALSGGQKARIALARSIYKQADIYLLDDPLSAVDAAVGRKLFNECIKTFLQDKICILVTHQLQYLQQADNILILNKGTCDGMGTYPELQKCGLDFVQLLGDKKEDVGHCCEGKTEDKGEKIPSKPETRLEKEAMKTGAVAKSTYGRYMHSGGNYFELSFLLLLFVLYQVASRGSNYFLSYWVNTEEFFAKNEIDPEIEYSMRHTLIYVYAGVIVATILFAIYHKAYFFVIMMRASVNLHNHIFKKLLDAQMHFFNITPIGRILNRFSKDLGIVDEYLPTVLYYLFNICMHLLGIIVLTSLVKVWLLGPAIVLFMVFYAMRCFYIKGSRSVKRIEGVNRSPIFNQVSATLAGLSTIRALGVEHILVEEFHRYQDDHTTAYWMFLASTRAFGMWLDLTCLIFISIVIIVLMTVSTDMRGGDMGLIITQYMGLLASVQVGMRQWSDLETNMTSVERVLEYTELDNEPQRETKQKLPENWPRNGIVQFQNITMKYLPQEPSILNNINFTANAGEKIGIVGRSGAGKSSIITALFQLYSTNGAILIDDVDVTKISLHDLRSKISIIPQAPVLFEGTMRKNLDPFDQYSDDMLWHALDQVKLKEHVANMSLGLQNNITEGGANFSVGQRQLLCLARAIVRKNKIFVLDEATANVDPYTDEVIQNTIRIAFKDCTVLTIAHRLQTVMDSDKILVIDAGEVVEFGEPYELLKNKDGKFRGMVEVTGASHARDLLEIAEKAHVQRKRE